MAGCVLLFRLLQFGYFSSRKSPRHVVAIKQMVVLFPLRYFFAWLDDALPPYAQGDRTSLTNEPVTVNATEDSMTLAWGVVEELMRLADMHSGAGVGFGDMGVGNDYSDEEEGDSEQVIFWCFMFLVKREDDREYFEWSSLVLVVSQIT